MPSLFLRNTVNHYYNEINRLINEEHRKSFVLYPNGKDTTLITSIIDELGGIVDYCIDNKNYDGIGVLNIKEAIERDNSYNTFIITNGNPSIYEELRNQIYSSFQKSQIFDMFPSKGGIEIYEHFSEEELKNILFKYKKYNTVKLKGRILEPITTNAYDLRSSLILSVEKCYSDYSIIKRKTLALAAYWEKKPLNANRDDVFAGNISRCGTVGMSANLKNELYNFNKSGIDRNIEIDLLKAERIGLFIRNAGYHIIPNYEGLLNHGLSFFMNKVVEELGNINDDNQKDFLESECILVSAFKNKIERYAEEYKKYDNEAGIKISNACFNISENKPDDLFEAIQLLILAHEAILDEAGSGSISFGRLDQYLYPYYLEEISKKNTTKNEVNRWICELWKKISKYEMGWQNVTIGGGDINGNDVSNELTVMCMDASICTRCDQPQLSLRVPQNGMDDNIWDKSLELMQLGMGFPSLFNDDVAIPAKMSAGVSFDDACNYGIIGCVEIGSCGNEYAHTEGARINLLKLLELILNDGECMLSGEIWELAEKKDIKHISSFTEFYEWYKRELTCFIEKVCAATELLSEEYGKCWPVPLTSIFMQGCIESKRDVANKGTIYNNLSLNCVGIASCANSLEAIENIVFKKKIISLVELQEALEHNFIGYEKIKTLLEQCPKYGNDVDSVDNKYNELVDLVLNTVVGRCVPYSGGKWQLGLYSSYFHAQMGQLTAASADGRLARSALSSSFSPMAGTDTNGPIALINSVNKSKMNRFGNGMALDLKFLPSFFNQPKNKHEIKNLIKTYFERGGLEIQINVVDKATLLAAKRNPAKYRNLIVRVSGYSAYFVSLEENLQDEIIARTEQCCG